MNFTTPIEPTSVFNETTSIPSQAMNTTTIPITTTFTTETPYSFVEPINKIEMVLAFSFIGIVTIGCVALGIRYIVKQCRRPKNSYDIFYDQETG